MKTRILRILQLIVIFIPALWIVLGFLETSLTWKAIGWISTGFIWITIWFIIGVLLTSPEKNNISVNDSIKKELEECGPYRNPGITIQKEVIIEIEFKRYHFTVEEEWITDGMHLCRTSNDKWVLYCVIQTPSWLVHANSLNELLSKVTVHTRLKLKKKMGIWKEIEL